MYVCACCLGMAFLVIYLSNLIHYYMSMLYIDLLDSMQYSIWEQKKMILDLLYGWTWTNQPPMAIEFFPSLLVCSVFIIFDWQIVGWTTTTTTTTTTNSNWFFCFFVFSLTPFFNSGNDLMFFFFGGACRFFFRLLYVLDDDHDDSTLKFDLVFFWLIKKNELIK